jgi:hypothetical protein
LTHHLGKIKNFCFTNYQPSTFRGRQRFESRTVWRTD